MARNKALNWLAAAICSAGVLGSSAAIALMPPQSYLTARAEAPRHVQIRITKVRGPVKDEMACEVSGRVIKSFRGDLKYGHRLKLKVDCNPPKGGFSGPQIYTDLAELRTARFAEVYLTADDAPQVMLWQFHIIKEASSQPKCNTKQWACD